MRRLLWLSALLALSLSAQTLKIVVQNPTVLKEIQAGGGLPPQVKLVTASGADLTREIADADRGVGVLLAVVRVQAEPRHQLPPFRHDLGQQALGHPV